MSMTYTNNIQNKLVNMKFKNYTTAEIIDIIKKHYTDTDMQSQAKKRIGDVEGIEDPWTYLAKEYGDSRWRSWLITTFLDNENVVAVETLNGVYLCKWSFSDNTDMIDFYDTDDEYVGSVYGFFDKYLDDDLAEIAETNNFDEIKEECIYNEY